MTSCDSLQVSPDQLIFRDVNLKETETSVLRVLNTGTVPIKVRFLLTKGLKSPFKMTKEGLFNIPPGLEAIQKVKFTAPDYNQYDDSIRIDSPGGSITVPIIAYPPAPRLILDQHKINLPGVSVNCESSFCFKLTNVGVADANFSLKARDYADTIKFHPGSGSLGPAETIEIKGVFSPKTVESFKTEIDIICNELLEKIEPIQFSANSLNSSISFIYNEKDVSDLDFKKIFFGQKKVINTKIINNSQQKRSFVILPPHDSSTNRVLTAKSLTFFANPSEGVLNPNDSLQVSFTFHPISNEDNTIDDFETDFLHYSAIEVVESSQRIDFQLVGKAVHHNILIPAVDFNFGESLVNKKSTQIMEIHNNSNHLPINYDISDVANFRFNPNKGTIAKNSSTKVEIIFYPKSFGNFDVSPIINFCNGLIKRSINCLGNCVPKLNAKPFVREPITTRDKNARFNFSHPDMRYQYTPEQVHKNEELRKQYDDYITDSARVRKDRTETKQFIDHTKKLAQTMFVKSDGQVDETEVKNFVKTKLRERGNQDDFTSLGIATCEGLEPPEPPVLKRPPKFLVTEQEKNRYNSNNISFDLTSGSRRKIAMDENYLIKKKFKPKPTTSSEINDCAKELTPAQQLMVDVSHQTLNFGEMSVHSSFTKSLNVTNNLNQFILFSINCSIFEISGSAPTSQVIPPKQTAGFDIKFLSNKACNFNETIEYTINSAHSFPLNITANVVPIDLQLSRNIIEFKFVAGSASPFIKEFVTIHNKSNGDAKFSWESSDPAFSLSTVTGVVEAKKSQNVEITYIPGTKNRDEATLIMNVDGGPSRSLKCVGLPGSPRCSLIKKKVDFGLIPVGISKTQTIRIKNSGEDDAIFSVTNPNLSELSITPTNGRIGAHDAQTYEITFKTSQAHAFDYNVVVEIAGSPSLNFNITGKSELPRVQLSVNEFEYGRVFVGSTTVKKAKITNVGNIPAILFLDLFSRPEFRIEYSSDLSDRNTTSQTCNSISLVSDPCFITTGFDENNLNTATTTIINKKTSIFHQSSDDNDEYDDDEIENNSKDGNGLIYKIIIVENSSIDFSLVFQPTEVNDHSFELPITLMNVATSASFHLQPVVSADVVQAPLRLSSNSLDFGIAPIFNPLNPHARPSAIVLKIFNEHKTSLKWRFDSKPDQIFNYEPQNGELEFGEFVNIHVTFTPRAAGPFHILLPLYAITEKEDSLISQIQLTGVGSPLKFKISHNDVYLPIVPLNVQSQKTVYVVNHAFIEATLKAETVFEKSICPIEISFPEGNKLQSTTVELPVSITFKSETPVSFSTIVAIIDEKGNATSFNVTCTADNSVFTLYPFLQSLGDKNIKINAAEGGKPILLDTKIDSNILNKINETVTSQFTSARDIIELKNKHFDLSSIADSKMIDFIIRYLNSMVMNSQINEFPGDFIRSDGSLLSEAILNLSGGKRMQFDLHDRSSNDNSFDNPVLKRRESIKKILHQFQSMGALISSVKPEFLLSRSDFLQLMRIKIIKKLLGIDYFNAPELNDLDQKVLGEFTSTKGYSTALINRVKVLENIYAALNLENWMIVITQLFKVFVLSRIDGEKFNSISGVTDTIKILKTFSNQSFLIDINRPAKSLSMSNVFSTSECALLKWLSLYLCREKGMLVSPITDFIDLSNSIGFASVISIHTGRSINVDSENDMIKNEKNAIELMNVMKQLKLSFIPKAEDIFTGNRIMLAVIAAYLCELMPHFFPKAVIEFETPLHKAITRSFSLSNPSKAEITYTATISDTDNFHLSKESVEIGPSGTFDFPIEFYARTVKPIKAKLELVPNRPRMVANRSSNKNNNDLNNNSKTPTTSCVSVLGAPRVPVFSAPIVIDLVTKVSFESPDCTFNAEGSIYSNTSINIPVKNFLTVPSSLKIKSFASKIVDEFDNNIERPSLPEIVSSLMAGTQIDSFDSQPLSTDNALNALIKTHKPFLIHESELKFEKGESEKEIEIEFIPISLGTYSLIILFVDDNAGEFVLEVNAKATVPPPIEVASGKLKSHAGQKISITVPIEAGNANLVRALAYSIEMGNNLTTYQNERKFKEQMIRRLREVDSIYKQNLSTEKFKIINSSTFFEIPNEINITKLNISDGKSNKNDMKITFKPSKAGEYPCHVLLISKNDVRHIQLNGIGIASTKEVTMDFTTNAGKGLKQDIPLQNPSDDVWNYKITITGDSSFSAPTRITAKPKEVTMLSINFHPFKIGKFEAELQIYNQNKESTVIYKLSGTVDEPPAEEKIIFNCQARQKLKHRIELKPFIRSSANIQVTSTIPIISFPSEVSLNSETPKPFEFTVLAQRSGLAAGTLTFTDPVTKSYIWYVLEIHVDSPEPEQTISVSTIARKSATISIPITNPKKDPVRFSVVFSDTDIFGEKEFQVNPGQTIDYKIVVSPLKAMKRISSVYFYSEEEGEFWYSLKIESIEPPESTLSHLTSPIGKSASTFVVLENPLTKPTFFRVENDNMAAFSVVAKRVIQLAPNEKKRVEIRYIPSSVGIKENATIQFSSNDTGDFIFHISGTGKPPPPLSPVIVSSPKDSVNSALILFTNPFPYPGRFAVSMSSQQNEVFRFLVKRKIFTLNSYGEEYQIPFSFAPKELGQYKAHIIVASLGPSKGPLPELESLPSVRWVYPIIGNSVSDAATDMKSIKCRAMTTTEEEILFTLVGETEIFDTSEYSLSLSMPPGYEFLRFALDAHATSVTRATNSTQLAAAIRFSPQRPLHCIASLSIRNPLGQEWQFEIELTVDRGKTISQIVIESLLNKQGTAKVSVPASFRSSTPFHAFFMPGSAVELEVNPAQGTIEPSFTSPTELPINIIFAPKMYGKMLKGVLVIDTVESQYLFDVVGKTPEYVPPDVSNVAGRIDNKLSAEVQQFHKMQSKRHRNIIKENIENAKTARGSHFTSKLTPL